MLYAGLDLSRKRLDFHLLDAEGVTVDVGASPLDADGLRGLTERVGRHGAPIRAAIESMDGARFVHDRLELADWQERLVPRCPAAAKGERFAGTASTSPATRATGRIFEYLSEELPVRIRVGGARVVVDDGGATGAVGLDRPETR